MSGFRKFRSSLHRRRRSLEAVELGFLTPNHVPESPSPQGAGLHVAPAPGPMHYEGEAPPLEFSPSVEAREIGPTPIAWLKTRRAETDN